MKKLNKKGFTLVELLAVVVILVIIMTVALPSISSSVERSKDKQTKAKIEVVETAAEIYYDINHSQYISIKDLYCAKLLTKEELKNPKNEKESLCGYVEYKDNTYTWKSTINLKENCIDLTKEYAEICS